MVRAERLYRYSGEPLSRGREFAPPKKEPFSHIDLIVAATGSSRRESLVRYIAEGIPVQKLPLGEYEPITPYTQRIVQDKLRRARSRIREEREKGTIPKGLKVAIIAADTQSGPLAISKKGVPILKNQSKPSKTEDVWRVFRGLAKASRLGQEPYYTITSSSGVAFDPVNGHSEIIPPDPLMSVLYLDPQIVQYLSTSSGFEEYQGEFERLHSSRTYTNGGDLEPVTLTSTAAGLSVPVLTRLGAVTRINETERKNPDFADEVRDAISIASAGISPVVLGAVNQRAAERMQTWPFLQRMTQYALEG